MTYSGNKRRLASEARDQTRTYFRPVVEPKECKLGQTLVPEFASNRLQHVDNGERIVTAAALEKDPAPAIRQSSHRACLPCDSQLSHFRNLPHQYPKDGE
mmetsp:Transcript_31869/g.123682  ORF Transcript_31869/g.123682 Transcript_31869/m.123682 type:complete len:100 (-) Transcript_31869:2641-2940(-)